MKTSGNAKMRTSHRPLHFFPTYDHISIHTKLIEAGYSFFDFPIWDPEWNKTVMKRAKLTDKRSITAPPIHSD